MRAEAREAVADSVTSNTDRVDRAGIGNFQASATPQVTSETSSILIGYQSDGSVVASPV